MRIGEGLRGPFVSVHHTAAVPSGRWLVHQPRYHLLSCLNRQIWQQNSWGWEGQRCPSWTGQTPPPSEQDMVDPASLWDIRPTAVRQGPAGDGRGAADSLGTCRVINCEWFIWGLQQRTGVETFLKELRMWGWGSINKITQSGHNHKYTTTT